MLFLSSNPSISEAGDHQSGGSVEVFPTAEWTDDLVADFATHRFDSVHGWATPYGHFKRRDGDLSPTPVAFWNNVRLRAAELLGADANPAVNYAMTEVVHCKSKSEKGVKKAATRCVDRHLDQVLALSKAPLIVVLGAKARDRVHGMWPVSPRFGSQKAETWNEVDNLCIAEVAGVPRLIAYLWHPTGSATPQTFATAFPDFLSHLRKLVDGSVSVADLQESF
jgi:hypothetical protein